MDSTVLALLSRDIELCAATVGLTPLDGEVAPLAPGQEIGQLEYRVVRDDGILVLGLYDVRARQTVTAELWSPDDVTAAPASATVDSVAIRRKMWRYDDSTDVQILAHEIHKVVEGWMADVSESIARPGTGVYASGALI